MSSGICVGFLPTWGQVEQGLGQRTGNLTPQNAEVYGEWLGRRYRDAGLV